MTLSVEINIGQQPIFIFPSGGVNAVLGGEVVLRLTGVQSLPIGGIKVEWTVWVERKARGKAAWSEKETLSNTQVTIGMDREIRGTTRTNFSLQLPGDLPPTRCTEFDRLSHCLTAVVLDPVPTYDNSQQCANTPPTPSSSPYASPSTSRNASRLDLSLPASSPAPKKRNLFKAVLRRHTADQTSIRQAVRRLSSAPRLETWFPEGLAQKSMGVEVVACHDGRGEVRRLDWHHAHEVEELGSVDIRTSSGLFILGSTVDMELILTGLASNATLHAASLSLVQHTIGQNTSPEASYFPSSPTTPMLDGSNTTTPTMSPLATPTPGYIVDSPDLPAIDTSEDPTYSTALARQPHSHLAPHSLPSADTSWTAFEVPVASNEACTTVTDSFRLYEAGLPHHPNEDRPPVQGEHLWRGPSCLERDEQRKERKLFGIKIGKKLPEVIKTTKTLRVTKRLHLPSPVLGALPTYRANPNISRVTHKLHLALYYSILGKDNHGNNLADPNAEGTMRVYWTEKPVVIGSCAGLSDNLVAPPYTPDADIAKPTETVKKNKTEGDYHPVVRSRAYGPKGRERMHDVGTATKVIKERMKMHEQETGGACACFTESSEEGQMVK